MASILKHDVLVRGGDGPQPIPFNMEDVQTRARDYLLEIQQQAAAILQRARDEAGAIRKQSQQEGLAEAQKLFDQRVAADAKKLSDQRSRTAIATCEESVNQLTTKTSEWLEAWRNQTVHLAVRMAEKLVRKELASRSQEILEKWLEEALRASRKSRQLRISVHPDDFDITGAALERLAKSIPHAAEASVVADAEVRRGGCVIVSEFGSIDLQLETQLERLIEQLDQQG